MKRAILLLLLVACEATSTPSPSASSTTTTATAVGSGGEVGGSTGGGGSDTTTTTGGALGGGGAMGGGSSSSSGGEGGCLPTFYCASESYWCGQHDDGCGHTVRCDPCEGSSQTCGPDGVCDCADWELATVTEPNLDENCAEWSEAITHCPGQTPMARLCGGAPFSPPDSAPPECLYVGPALNGGAQKNYWCCCE